MPDDVPGFDTLNSQEASRQRIIDAQSGIPELQQALEASDLLGAWAALYSNPEPPGTFISSVAYLFESPQGAASLVEATRNIDVADYLGALEAGEEPAAPVGEASVLMRFRTPDGYAYELTWAQGPAAARCSRATSTSLPQTPVTSCKPSRRYRRNVWRHSSPELPLLA